jgi:hypothetical protein
LPYALCLISHLRVHYRLKNGTYRRKKENSNIEMFVKQHVNEVKRETCVTDSISYVSVFLPLFWRIANRNSVFCCLLNHCVFIQRTRKRALFVLFCFVLFCVLFLLKHCLIALAVNITCIFFPLTALLSRLKMKRFDFYMCCLHMFCSQNTHSVFHKMRFQLLIMACSCFMVGVSMSH